MAAPVMVLVSVLGLAVFGSVITTPTDESKIKNLENQGSNTSVDSKANPQNISGGFRTPVPNSQPQSYPTDRPVGNPHLISEAPPDWGCPISARFVRRSGNYDRSHRGFVSLKPA
jgi:hypothetical protein